MTKPVTCEIHGMQAYVPTSPKLAEATKTKGSVEFKNLRRIKICCPDLDRSFVRIVDDVFFNNEFGETEKKEISLVERDKRNKKLNDRLLIRQFVNKLRYVCPICLSEISDSKNASGSK